MGRGIERWLAPGAIGMALLGVALALVLRAGGGDGETVRATLDLAEAMGGTDTAGYARALEPRPFVFPRDHGPHPDYRTEWWYVTANLDDDQGRRFGIQFTLFRSALAPEEPGAARRGSEWATRQVHMGHFAVTDVAGDAFHETERFTRVANGLAGGTVDPLRIWMDGWSFSGGGGPSAVDPAAGNVFPLRIRAREGEVAVDLELMPVKPHVLQGDRGLSQKGAEAGNASFYYSFTRLEARGTVEVGGQAHSVAGLAWLDREWSTSALSAGQEGWDWFALQLSDGRDLMVYRLRGPGDTTDPMSEGLVVAADGTSRRLAREDFTVTPTGRWTSPLDGAEYPSGWEVDVPSEGLALRVIPMRADQELNVAVRYWEGAVDVESVDGSGPTGRGYVELTGYSGAVAGRAPGEGAR